MSPIRKDKDRVGVICRALREAILKQAIEPGEKLPEVAIGRQFGTSRTIVRQALVQLASERLVVFQHNRGATVAAPTFQEASDIFELRAAIERLVIARLTDELTSAQLTTLRNHLKEERLAYKRDGRPSIQLATQFHLMLAEMTGSSVLIQYAHEVSYRCGLILALYSKPHVSACGLDEHQEIIDALATRNRSKATSAMDHHLDGIVDRALSEKGPRVQKGLAAALAPYVPASSPNKPKKQTA